MKNLKKYHKVYLVFFVFMFVLTAVFCTRAVMHPRPHNILVTIMSGIWTLCGFVWMNPEKYDSPYRHAKQDKVKTETQPNADNREQGRTRRLARSKAPGIGLTILVMLISFFMVIYMFSVIPDLLFPYHMTYEYKADIARLKKSVAYDYSFFPDEIPTGATHVTWVMLPSFLQGSGTEVLFFDIDDEFIRQTIAQYGGNAEIVGVEDGMIFDNYYDESRLDKLTVYKLYDNENWNHLHMWGFFVDEEIHRIGYFCQ